MRKNKVLIVGGDERQYYLAAEMWKKGFEIACYGMEKLESRDFVKCPKTLAQGMIDNDVILLPVPVLQDNLQIKTKGKSIPLSELITALRKGQIVFGGNLPIQLKETCEKKEVISVDYMDLEEIGEKNAVATAEGAIMEAMKISNVNIQGSHSLIMGFGKCGEALAEKLAALGARVTIMARSENARNKAGFCGYKTTDMFQNVILENYIKNIGARDFDFIFNTIPALVLDKKAIDYISYLKDKEELPVIIDIASAPGGVDFKYCKEKSIKAGLYLGIPGKYAPKTSGAILSEAVIKKLEQKMSYV